MSGEDFHDSQLRPCYLEADLQAGEAKSIYPVWIVMIVGAGILGQYAPKGLLPLGRHQCQQRSRDLHSQYFSGRCCGKAAQGLWMAVRIGDVWLDVQNRRTIHQIGPQDPQYAALVRRMDDSASFTQLSAMGLGRKGERVANTPIRAFPPSRGGRTVGDQVLRMD